MAEDEKESNLVTDRTFYCLYTFEEHASDEDSGTKNDNETSYSLTLLMSDLMKEAEPELTTFLSIKLTRGSFYTDTGCIAMLEYKEQDETRELSCYYARVICSSTTLATDLSEVAGTKKYIVCFLSSHSNLLDHFLPELNSYAAEMSTVLLLQDDATCQKYLGNWTHETIEYLGRCLSLVKHDVKYLIYCALVDGKLVIEGGTEQNKRDLSRFIKSCNLSDMLRQMDNEGKESSSNSSSLDMLLDLTDDSTKKPIKMKIAGDQVKFASEGCTKFCEDWGKLLYTADTANAGHIRQIIEAGKVKYIQSINTLKRLLIQAEKDYYALYRAYVFLKNSGNSDILLHCVHLDKLPEVSCVFRSLEEFITETQDVS